MRKTKTLILILVFILSIIFPLTINAADYQIDPESYHSDGPSTSDVKDMYSFGGSVASVVQIVGTIVSIGAMVIIGIRYVVASADEKAEYKERMLPYIIGCVLLFGSSNIVNTVYKITNPKIVPLSEEWIANGGKMVEISCKGSTCNWGISIYLPQENDVNCSRCGKLVYDASKNEIITSNAKIIKTQGF